jgi:Uma2 family endonuclease
MPRLSRNQTRATKTPGPTWEVAYLFPTQGQWSEAEYLALNGNQLVEFSRGTLEVLPMPTTSHQLLVAYLYGLLSAFVTERNLGIALIAPLRVRLWRGKFREPDVLFMLKAHINRIGEEYWQGADLVMEVVSEDDADRRRDLETKRQEYCRAGIAEYWIVDSREGRITVLRKAGRQFVVHGEFVRGEMAMSHLLEGFQVDVTAAFSRKVIEAARIAKKRRRSR